MYDEDRQTQIDLFGPQKSAIQKAFDDYDRGNPAVWELFKRFTNEAISAGLEHFGSQAILERIRWETSIATSGLFKINNNFGPFYARKFHRHFPQYKGFFRTRESVADTSKTP